MSVYYIHAKESGMVKIGFAKDPWSRFGKMKVDSPVQLDLLAFEDGDKDIEASRHSTFADLREHGEWFRFVGPLVAYVRGLPRAVKPINLRRDASPLFKWIKANGHTLASFSEIVGTTQATLSRVCDGKQFPRRALMISIVEATNWEVDANALLEIPAKPRASFAA